jgi:hypothetical protein
MAGLVLVDDEKRRGQLAEAENCPDVAGAFFLYARATLAGHAVARAAAVQGPIIHCCSTVVPGNKTGPNFTLASTRRTVTARAAMIAISLVWLGEKDLA